MAVDFGAVFDDAFNTNFFDSAGENFDRQKRTLKSTTSFARMVVFHYLKANFGDAISVKALRGEAFTVGLFDTESVIIEAEIISIKTTKNISSVAGTFETILMPSQNWKRRISPGDWCIIYLYSNKNDFGSSKDFEQVVKLAPPNENIIFFGNIDRISKTKQKDEATDKTIVRYRVSGRDFGKVFEQTDLWFDPYKAEAQKLTVLQSVLTAKGLPFTGNPNDLVSAIIDVFLGSLGSTEFKTLPLKQWRIPLILLRIFGGIPKAGTATFEDILTKKFTPSLPGFKVRSMVTPKSSGALWNMLKRNCNDLVNELFVELVREQGSVVSKPSIVMRPRPNSKRFQDRDGGLDGAFESLQDRRKKEGYTISPIDIIFEDLGKDDQVRTNMIWLESRQSTEKNINIYANIYIKSSLSGVGLPMVQQESLERYGLKRFHASLDFCYGGSKSNKQININAKTYKSFIGQLYDHKAFLHLYETGTLETPGEPRAELGKVLGIQSEKVGEPDRIYYIEGYQHNWDFPGIWKTQYVLTMGQFDISGRPQIGPKRDVRPFIDLSEEDDGEFDTAGDEASLVQTSINRGVGIGLSESAKNSELSKIISEIFTA